MQGYEVNQTSDGEKEIAESKAEELSEALDVEVGVSGGEERCDLEDKKKEEHEKVSCYKLNTRHIKLTL